MRRVSRFYLVTALVFALLLASGPGAGPARACDGKADCDQVCFDVYGFIKVDTVYDFKRVPPDWNFTMRPSQIPVKYDEGPPHRPDGEFILSVRPSRIGCNLKIPTDDCAITGKIEFDFVGVGTNSGQNMPRLRHVYGEYGALLGGQTWSLFSDPDAFPMIMDFWGPNGVLVSRRPQIRWTPHRGDASDFALSIGTPGAGVDAGRGPQVDENFDARFRGRLPDVSFRFRTHGKQGYLQIAGIVRSLGYEGSYLAQPGRVYTPFDGAETGYGAMISTHIKTAGKSGFRGLFSAGRGYANYVNDGAVDLAHNGYDQAEAVPLLTWLAFYEAWWSQRWSTTLGGSEVVQTNTGGQEMDAFRRGRYALVDLVYHPNDRLLYGLELQWGERMNKDKVKGDDVRLQFSAKYSF